MDVAVDLELVGDGDGVFIHLTVVAGCDVENIVEKSCL